VSDEQQSGRPSSCETCGFEWDSVAPGEAKPRILETVSTFVEVIVDAGPMASQRPSPERWSVLEYGAHLRDVFLSQRERIIAASVEDRPVGSPIFRDERVDLGFYALEEPGELAEELTMAAQLLVRTVDALPQDFEERPLVYSRASPMEVSIAWVVAQGLHEAEHHLADVELNVQLLRAAT
jgi:hypothetical protein